MDGLQSYTELLSRFGVPGSTRFAETSYGIQDGAGCSSVGFAGSESSYGIDGGAGCSGVGFAGSESSYGIDEGAGCSGVGFAGSDCYFDDGASDSSGSGFSSDSSDPEEEDDRDELEGAVDRDAGVDVAHDEEDNIPADEHYATACEELAKEMREAAAAPPPGLFVPKENAFYIKRKRTAKGVELPTGRPPSEVGAIEAALRASVKKKKSEIFYPTPGTVFDSIEEAHEFYNLYSWEVGFGIKYGRSNKNKGNDYRTMQQFECANAGKDTRCVYQSQRSGCRALMKLFRTEDHGWYVSQLITEHNHQLSECCGEKRQWQSHRAIDGYTKDMIRNLRENNVSLSKVHTILGSLHGGVQELPYTKRSIRTICAQIARDQLDDDVKKTLEEFRKMRQDDPNFAFSVDLDALNRVKTLIWTNSRSKMQYTCFGDVVTFDTTFCTNIYKMPFGLFVGVNNHFQSAIFGGVLMRDETHESFVWVFKEFLSLMGGKQLLTVLTDQCIAMATAMVEAMPGTTHLWCKWLVGPVVLMFFFPQLCRSMHSHGHSYGGSNAWHYTFVVQMACPSKNILLNLDSFVV